MSILKSLMQKKIILVLFVVLTAMSLIIFIFFIKSINATKYKNLNIILIVVDALRQDHLGCYGYQRNTSPNIDRLAKEGTRFTQAITAGCWTLDSVPSILTGTYSPTHHIRDWHSLKNPKISTLAQLLKPKGYESVLWSNHGTLSHLDIRHGFQRVYTQRRYKNNRPTLNDYNLTSNVIKRLKVKYKNLPFFFYIHYEGCHVPYRPPAPYKYMYLHDRINNKSKVIPISSSDDRIHEGYGKIPYIVAENNITNPNYYISQYDGAISYTDAQIGRLLRTLKEMKLDKNTLIILTADHGEMLGEHNFYFIHGPGYEEVLKVPLIIRFPELVPKGKVITRQVSLVDIVPTILEILRLKIHCYIQGNSLLALIKSNVWHGHYKKQLLSFIKKNYVLRNEDWKLIYNGEPYELWELYNLKRDPKEQRNLITENPHKFKQLRQELHNFVERVAFQSPIKNPHSLMQEDKEQLRSLGYMQ